HQDREGERALAGDAGDLREAPPEDVAEEAEGGGPGARAEHVIWQEAPVAQPRRPGSERHQRTHEADPAPEEDRLPSVPVEVALDFLQPVLGETHLRPEPLREAATVTEPDQEADRVARDHRGPHDPDQQLDRERSLAGEYPAEDHR